MSANNLVIRGPRVVLPDSIAPASIYIVDDKIVDVGAYDRVPDGSELVEAGEASLIMAGLVDTHVHINEPGRTEWEGFASATRAAAAGGVTTVVDMPLNSIPPTVNVKALHVKRQAAEGQLAVDVAFWGGAVPGNASQLRRLHEAGVVGFKCFLLDSGVPEFPPLDDDGLRAALAELATFDGLLIAHCEDDDVIAHSPQPEGTSYTRFLGSRPGAAEQTAIGRLIAAARDTGGRVHVVHLAD